jgi:hypothetical protein
MGKSRLVIGVALLWVLLTLGGCGGNRRRRAIPLELPQRG